MNKRDVWCRWLLGALLASCATHLLASEAKDAEKPYSFSFKPVVIDSSEASGAAFGVDYDFKVKKQFATSRGTSAGSPIITPEDVDKPEHAGQFDFRLRGTLASAKEKNPNKLVDLASKVVYTYDTNFAYFKGGGVFAYETDQGFDHKQHVLGVSGSMSKVQIVVPGDAGSLLLNYGSVKPTADTERKTALANGSLDSYRRWNLEASYSYPINRERIRSVHFDYRHYQEMSPPTAVKTAGLDRHRLGLVRVDLDQGFFLQYSRGSLPFDVRSVSAVKIGWSTNLEPLAK